MCQLPVAYRKFLKIMKIKRLRTFLVLFLLAIFSCKKPYNPAATNINFNYLVVEGVINSGPDSTIIKLSRTTTLGSGDKITVEANALVTVLSDAGDHYALSENTPGIYTFNGLNLSITKKYCLQIKTSNGEEYQSAFIANAQSPAIDSVSYSPQATGLQFYVNTHDVNNNTRYYRWDYDETWTYFSFYNSVLDYKDKQVVKRPFDSSIYECYHHSTPSNSIFIATSNQLGRDVINHYPLGYTDASTGKISHVYSLLVKQYAITADAYKYWGQLQKNTEQLGSIFDTQPSSIPGNINCITNPNEPVIGFISVSTISTKRIFVSGNTLPFHVPNQVPPPYLSECGDSIIYITPAFTFDVRAFDLFASGENVLIDVVENPGSDDIVGYTYAKTPCVDCRVSGGTNIKPSYWPY
jgi:Domain of unknown function (DUF4249)